MMAKPTIIWLDDLLNTPDQETIQDWRTFMESAANLIIASSINEFAHQLEVAASQGRNIDGIVIDLMLTHGIDEPHLGRLGVRSQRVAPLRAGLQVLKVLLSSNYDQDRPNPRASYLEHYRNTPVALFSTNGKVGSRGLFCEEFSPEEADTVMKRVRCIYQSSEIDRTIDELRTWISVCAKQS